MFDRILVPLDGSVMAESALPYAEKISNALGSEIIIAGISQSGTNELFKSYLSSVIDRLKSQLQIHRPEKEPRVFAEAFECEPAIDILTCCFKRNISLVTMTSRGASNQGPWPIGSVAAKVLRASNQPVLLVKTPSEIPTQQNKKLFGKILVPLDGSQIGEAALPFVETIAIAMLSEVVLFHVTEMPSIWSGINFTTFAGISQEDIENWKEPVKRYLQSMQSRFAEKGISASTIIEFGSPASCIIDCAKSNTINLIAMSTHGRSGIGRWVFGSVTDKVIHSGDNAILIIRAKQL